jgi:ATP-binding cassette subfamily B protein
MTASRDGGPAADQLDNRMLIRRLFALAWRYRLHCLRVLGIQLVLLTLGIAGLGFTGIGVDYVRHKVAGTPLSANRLHLTLPDDWPPLQVLGLLAGLILLFALVRAVLNYTYAVWSTGSCNKSSSWICAARSTTSSSA